MAASVRIEDEAFADARYDVLAGLLDTSKYDALGRMAYVWRWCTQRRTYVVPSSLLEVYFDDPSDLIRADLAEEVDGGYRIKGTRGRIEWLSNLRKSSKKGGVANRAKWLSKRKANGQPDASPPSPAPAPAPSGKHTKKVETPLPADWQPNPTHQRLATERGLDLSLSADDFRDHAATKGRKCVDWDAAFRMWIRKAPNFANGTKPPPVLVDGLPPGVKRW